VTNRFSTIATNLTDDDVKFNGAAVVGSKVYFAPCDQDNVGVLDTGTNRFSTIATNLTDYGKFDGAAVVGSKVYFVPYIIKTP